MRRILYGLGIIVIAAGLWFRLRKMDRKTDAQTVSQTLPPQDKAKIIVDEKHHTYTTVARGDASTSNRNQVVTRFLAPTASIETKPDGSVIVTSRSFGTELSPWAGVSLDSETHGRWALGLNVFYWQRFELGTGLSRQFRTLDPRVFVSGSYNVYSNLLLTAAIDNHKTVSVGVALKF